MNGATWVLRSARTCATFPLESLGAMTKPFRDLHLMDEGGVEAVGGVEAEGVSIHLTVGGAEVEGGAVDGVEAVGRVGEAPLLLRGGGLYPTMELCLRSHLPCDAVRDSVPTHICNSRGSTYDSRSGV